MTLETILQRIMFDLIKLVCISVLLFSESGRGTSTCKDGWLAYGGSCYLFRDEEMSFTVAEQYCRQHDSHLVHVNDATENAFLKDQLRSKKSPMWWLGLTDEGIEGVWKWFDTDTEAEFLDFHAGDGGNHMGEDCAIFNADYNHEWVDVYCASRVFPPICETESLSCEGSVIG